MSTINAFIRTKNYNKPTNIRFRMRKGREIDVEYKSDIIINPLLWNSKKQIVRKSMRFPDEDVASQNKRIADLRIVLEDILMSIDAKLTTSAFYNLVQAKLYPNQNTTTPKISEFPKLTFFELFDLFLKTHTLGDERRASYKVVKRALERFEFIYSHKERNFTLSLDTLTVNHINEFELFLLDECEFAKNYKEYKIKFRNYKLTKPRGVNTVIGMLKQLRAFNNWAIKHDYTTNYSFKNYKFKKSVYGTPIFLTLNELQKIYEHNFAFNKQLEIQRDIFIFQSMTGMRIGDMYRLTRANIINGCLHYIPHKTRKESGRTIVVPLNEIAIAIINKYIHNKSDTLLPFISSQKYNDKIKEILTFAGIIRNVTVINPITRNYEFKAINQIASSHLARRNFIANLYLHVQDQALLSSLTGHVPNSRSFQRYRQITDELKEKIVNHLNFK